MLDVFTFQLVHTPKEVDTTVSTSDLFFVQNLSEREKMELVSEVTHKICLVVSLFSLIVVGKGDVLTADNPSKEMDTWKGKYEVMEHKCYII